MANVAVGKIHCDDKQVVNVRNANSDARQPDKVVVNNYWVTFFRLRHRETTILFQVKNLADVFFLFLSECSEKACK